MEKLVNNKKYLTFILIGLLTLVIGVSLSYIMFDLSGSDNSIQTGQIFMTYVEPSNEVFLKDQLPISDELGKNSDKYFEFSVMSNITTNEDDDMGYNMPYEISLSKTMIDKMFNILKDEDVKVYLTEIVGEEEQVVVEPILVSELETSDFDNNSYKIYDTKNRHHNNEGAITTKYRIRFWIDNRVNATDWYKENKYEYRFVINVNGYAEKNMELTLSQKIKELYNLENGAAKFVDGIFYLHGAEDKESVETKADKILESFLYYSQIYIYRLEDGSFNSNLLEKNIKDFFITNSEITEEMYDEVTKPFGGYLNMMLAQCAGLIEDNGDEIVFVEGKTKDDIPTIEEILEDENLKNDFLNDIEIILEVIFLNDKNIFLDLYYDNNKFNKKLLDQNIELGLIEIYDLAATANLVKDEIGSLSDYIIGTIYESVSSDSDGNIYIIEGKTIPTLEEVFINEVKEIPVITNNYIKLNNELYEILSINKDNSINLTMADYEYHSVALYSQNLDELKENATLKYLGVIDDEVISYYDTIKNTSLGNIIVPRVTKYTEYNKNYKELSTFELEGYRRGVTKEEIINSYNDEGNFIDIYELTGTGFRKEYWTGKGRYVYEFLVYQDYLEPIVDNDNSMFIPIITIKDIVVSGEGTKENPYYIENEIVSTNEQIALDFKNYVDTLTDVNPAYTYKFNSSYSYLNFINTINIDKSIYTRSVEDDYTDVSVNIGDYCYRIKSDEIVTKEELINDTCNVDVYPNIVSNSSTSVYAFSFEEKSFSVDTENVTSYQWQQKVGNEWIDLEDISERISGTKTNKLTIIPTSYFNEKTIFRCLVSNDIKTINSEDFVMRLFLSDGEFVYREIEDTNKYEIVSYIGEPANSQHMTVNQDDNTKYDLIVPSIINGDIITKITGLDSYAHKTSTWLNTKYNIKTITISNGIKEINANITSSSVTKVNMNDDLEVVGNSAFQDAILTEVDIPDNVKKIGRLAFEKSLIEKLEISKNIVLIDEKAFYSSPLVELKLNDKLELIKTAAFYNAKLEELIIPSSTKIIEGNAFYNSPLTRLILNEGLEEIQYGSFEKAILTELVLPETLVSVGTGSFYNSNLTELILPSNMKIIGRAAFFNSKIEKLNIPGNIEKIEKAAFYNSPLTQLTLNKGIKRIEGFAFYNAQLKELVIPEDLEFLGQGAFANSPLTKLTLNEGLKILEMPNYENELYRYDKIRGNSGVFLSAQLTTLELPNTLEIIGSNAFYSSQLTSLEIPGSVKTIGQGSFFSSPLIKLTLNEGLEVIDSKLYSNNLGTSYRYNVGAFESAKLTELELPSTLKHIGAVSFANSPLISLKLNNGLTQIDRHAFLEANLKTLEIPSSVKVIQAGAFENSPLEELTLHEGIESIESKWTKRLTINGSYYEQDNFSYVFNSSRLKSIKIPASLTRLGMETFGTYPLEEVIIYGTKRYENGYFTLKEGVTIQYIDGTLE